MVLRPSGSGPTETSNSSNWPGAILVLPRAVQVIRDTASVILRSPDSTGLASLLRVTVAAQPGCGLMLTEASGVLVGKETASLMGLAVADSVGTRKVSFAKPPGAASRGFTVTCADAGAASRTEPARAARVAPPPARQRRSSEVWGSADMAEPLVRGMPGALRVVRSGVRGG